MPTTRRHSAGFPSSIARLTFVVATIVNGSFAVAEDAISTDRPDFVESSDVVARGVMQIEIGATLERDHAEEAIRTLSTPTLLRYGVGSNLELRLETDGRVQQRVENNGSADSATGVADISVGIKWHVADGERHRPALAVLLHADMPSGSAEFRGYGVRPSLRGVAEWELSPSISVAIMPGIVYDRNEQHRFVSGLFAVTTGLQLTEHLHGFVEIAGQQFARIADGGNVITYDTGIAYTIGSSVQVDAFVSRGANDLAPDWTYGSGVSIRFR